MNIRYDKDTLPELKKIQAPLKNTHVVDFTSDMTVGLLTRQYAITDANAAKPILGIAGALTCIALVLYDTKSKTAVAAHLDVETKHDLTSLLKHLSPETTIAHLAGGMGDLDGMNLSQKYCLEIVNFLKENQIRIENADIIRNAKSDSFSLSDVPSIAIDTRTGNIYSPVNSFQLELSIDLKLYLPINIQIWQNMPLRLCYSSKNISVNNKPNSLLVKNPESRNHPFFNATDNNDAAQKNNQTDFGFKKGFLNNR